MPKQEGRSIKYEVVAKAFGGILVLLFMGWIGWISLAVIELNDKDKEDQAQWKSIHELRAYHMLPAESGDHEH